jgi:hypothetical protein
MRIRVDQGPHRPHHATVVTRRSASDGYAWVLFAYRVPREPSSPRIAVWRKLKRLGVAQVGDGLVALPADPRTTEALEWVANDVLEAGGQASVWTAQPLDRATENRLVSEMRRARTEEYGQLEVRVRALADALPSLSAADGLRRLQALRAEVRKVQRRDYFPPPERARVTGVLRGLARTLVSPPAAQPGNQAGARPGAGVGAAPGNSQGRVRQ